MQYAIIGIGPENSREDGVSLSLPSGKASNVVVQAGQLFGVKVTELHPHLTHFYQIEAKFAFNFKIVNFFNGTLSKKKASLLDIILNSPKSPGSSSPSI